jgi:predicted glutamine amidotransferase
MCGIVGIAGNLLATDGAIFNEMLYADVVRGKHATGVAVVKGQCRSVAVHKRAMPAALYMELGSTIAHLSYPIQNTVMLGHNRHATKGNSGDPEGAHPFTHGHITLVHNGSLTTHSQLTDEHFTVDSEAICKAISVDGIEEVGPKLRGAFALVWIDSLSNTLNFLRNDERPLAIAWNTTANRMWWASELDMLKWVINRDTFTRSPATYDTIFNLPVGKLISIPITHTAVNITDRTESEIDVSDSIPPVIPYNYSRANYITPDTALNTLAKGTSEDDAEVSDFLFSVPRENALKKLSASIVTSRGKDHYMLRSLISSLDMDCDAVVLDDRIGMFLTHWRSYTTDSNTKFGSGAIHGQSMEAPYIPLVIHGFSHAEYLRLSLMTDNMISAYISGFSTPAVGSITINNAIAMPPEDARKFSVVLRKDSIRTADVDSFYWDMATLPANNTIAFEMAQKIFLAGVTTAADESVSLTLDEDVEVPGPEDPLRTYTLKDDSKVSPGGTACYSGNLKALISGYRYNITKIEYDKIFKVMHLTCRLGDKDHIGLASDFTLGKLSSEALEEKADVGKPKKLESSALTVV